MCDAEQSLQEAEDDAEVSGQVETDRFQAYRLFLVLLLQVAAIGISFSAVVAGMQTAQTACLREAMLV